VDEERTIRFRRELLETLLGKQPTPETHRLLARADEGSGMFAQACQQYQLAAQDEHGEEDSSAWVTN